MDDSAANWLAAGSFVVAIFALWFAKRSVDAAGRSAADSKRSADAAVASAEVARAEDHARRRPQLRLELAADAGFDGGHAIYYVHNEGPTDMDSVVVHEPVPNARDGFIHYIGGSDGGGDWGETAEIGPVKVGTGTYGAFTQAVGVLPELPNLKVWIVGTALGESCSELIRLSHPRPRVRPL